MAGTHTLAFGINVPKALGDFLVLQAVRESSGTAIAVSDEEILVELGRLAAAEGTWICPEGRRLPGRHPCSCARAAGSPSTSRSSSSTPGPA